MEKNQSKQTQEQMAGSLLQETQTLKRELEMANQEIARLRAKFIADEVGESEDIILVGNPMGG